MKYGIEHVKLLQSQIEILNNHEEKERERGERVKESDLIATLIKIIFHLQLV